ncbi:hypothetical protein Q3G72_023717 [Acer saccharum]|nr:hypothetical protein Q3G72_023717 [Acer saccharum]
MRWTGVSVGFAENNGKSVLVRKHLGAATFNNITRLAFGKRFVNSESVMDKQGDELKAIEEAFTKNGDRRDRLSKAIVEEHTLARQNSGGAKQHFVDALLTLQGKYDLNQ